MKTLLVISWILVVTSLASTEELTPQYKNWKTFRSDYGYELKYPDCWELRIDSPYEEGNFKQIKDIWVGESKKCQTTRRNPENSNGLGIGAGWKPIESKEELKKRIDRIEKWAKRVKLVSKRIKIGNDEAVAYVEVLDRLKNSIRWQMVLYCPSQEIEISGVCMKNPAPSYYEKFKAGDLGLPEPEKTIWESIRCVEPKKIENKK